MNSLISNEYRDMQAKLHENPDYGVASTFFAPIVDDVIQMFNITSLLDYGAGKCRLKDSMKSKVTYTPYEPSNPLWSQTPEPNEFVTCIDVLEHIEPELLDNVLDDLKRVVDKYGLFTIHTLEWWNKHLSTRFTIVKQVKIDNGCIVLVKKQ